MCACMEELTMHCEVSTGSHRSNIITGITSVGATITETNIQHCQAAKVHCTSFTVDAVFGGIHIILSTDDIRCFYSPGIDEGPGNLMLWRGQSVTCEDHIAAIVDGKLGFWWNGNDRGT